MEKAPSNDDLDETLQTLRKNYEAILGRIENSNKKPNKLFNNNVPLKLRPSIVDRALQRANEETQKKNALPSSTPMVQNKKPIFTPEDSLDVSPIHQDDVVDVENNNNRVENNDTVITISSSISETLQHTSQTKIKHERISVRDFENSPESTKNRTTNLESVIAKLTEPLVNKTVQTSRKSLNAVKKAARNTNVQIEVEIQEGLEIQQRQREIQTQTGDSLNRKVSESESSGMSGLSDALETLERQGLTPKKQERKGGAGRNDAQPWRPSGLDKLPSTEFRDGDLSDDEESLDDDTFLPAKPPTKKVFTNKRKTLANKTTTNRSRRSSKGNKGSVDRRVTRSSGKRLIDVAIGTSSLEGQILKSNRKKQKAFDHSEEEAEIATRRTSTKGVQVQESIDEVDRRTKEVSHVEVAVAVEEVPCQECTFDMRVSDESVAEQGAPNKKEQSTRKKNNGILPALTKKTRRIESQSVGDDDFQTNKMGTEESESKDENEIGTENMRTEEISAKKAEVSRKDRCRRTKEIQEDISSKKVQKKTVVEDSQSENENLQEEAIAAEKTEVHRKFINQTEQKVPAIIPKEHSSKKVKKAISLKSEIENEEGCAKQIEDVTLKNSEVPRKDRSGRAKGPREVSEILPEKRKNEIVAEDLEREKEILIDTPCRTECATVQKTQMTLRSKSRRVKEVQRDSSSKKVQNIIVTANLQSEGENLQNEDIPVKETGELQKHRSRSTKEVKEVPATTPKESEDFQEERLRQIADTFGEKTEIFQKGRSRRAKESQEVPAIASKVISVTKRKTENSDSEKENSIDTSCQTESTKVSRKNRSRKAKEPRKVPAKNVLSENVRKETVTDDLESEGENLQEEVAIAKKSVAGEEIPVDKRQTSIEDAEFAVEGSLVNEVFMEETTPGNEKVPLNNRKSPEKTEILFKKPIVILSDVIIEQKKTASTEVAGTSHDHPSTAGISLPNQKALKKSPCRRLEWSDDDSSPPEIRTPPKKSKRTPKTKRRIAKATSEASTVSDSSNESTVRRSTRERRAATSRFMNYYQCLASSGAKSNKRVSAFLNSISGSFSLPSNSSKNRSSNQRVSIRTDAPTLEEIPEEDEPQPGPSQPKRSVISGRVSKRENPKKSTKKAVKVLSNELQKEGQNLLNFYVGGKLQSFEWMCKEPKYKPVEEIPGVSMAITVSAPFHGQSSGYLKIEPGKMKPKLLTNKHLMSFFVIQGQGEVGVGDQRQIVTVPANFVIPKGSEYYIKNTSKAKPMILGFTRNLPPDDDVSNKIL